MLKMIFIQMDIIGAYLESVLNQNKHSIFMRILQRCLVNWEYPIYKTLKSLYGLKQVRQFWNKTITKFFSKIGFSSTNTDIYILII